LVKRKPPDGLVVMGRITAPFGVQGWVKIYALTAKIENLDAYPVWWLKQRDGDWREISVARVKVNGKMLVAQLAGVEDRDAAAELKGADIAVPREQLPRAAEGEFYWADLIGLKVVNAEQHDFGRVTRILQTGANDVLAVQGDEAAPKAETLIPFIAGVITHVDIDAGLIRVDWGKDY
jgi:16S rRNA processing protein RimM